MQDLSSDKTVRNRKLIEVALPLEKINTESAREKEPFTRRHPRSLHIWWARRPLTAVRALLFAQLVDDPSSRPSEFPTEAAQRTERERLHGIIERLAVWENSWDEGLLREAHQEIVKSAAGGLPTIIDPFAGGGSIPIEANRLGLPVTASDLNPVAVLINKALIEYPTRFRDRPPVHPELRESNVVEWQGASGLLADVRAYGEWIQLEAALQVGQRYPNVSLGAGRQSKAVAYIWCRTTVCPNPACGIDMPLVRTWWLSKKKGKETYIAPKVVGNHIEYKIVDGTATSSTVDLGGTVSGRTGAHCLACGAHATVSYLRAQGIAGGIGEKLLAVVAEGARTRLYLPPDAIQVEAAAVPAPESSVEGQLADNPRWFSPPAYGFTNFRELFTNRQLRTLTSFSELVMAAREKVVADGGSPEYADAVATYLGLAVSRYADMCNSLCSWNQTNQNIRALFSRQAVPMTWDFAEANPFGIIGLDGPIESICNSIYAGMGPIPIVSQASADSVDFKGAVVCTDPPYYDNIGYADLSDFFYVWLRRTLRDSHPNLLSTLMVPKDEELVANPYRLGSKAAAKEFFERGFRQVFTRARDSTSPEYPITVYYAFKQSESDADGEASSGWETLLEGMIQSGWEITSTWPVRSERTARSVGLGTNALASSIVLSLRPRAADARPVDRRTFIDALETELPDALRKLQQGQIAPVDLPQSAIGPGMAVFSRYSSVFEDDGSKMTVRTALARINEILDQVLNEQEGDFDPITRFAIAWYRQHGFGVGPFGDADSLARARNTSVDLVVRNGILAATAGRVKLVPPDEFAGDYDPKTDSLISHWEVLHHLLNELDVGGIETAASSLRQALSRPDGAISSDLVKELGHLLFRIAESNGAARDALKFNSLVTTWPEIYGSASTQSRTAAEHPQASFDFNETED